MRIAFMSAMSRSEAAVMALLLRRALRASAFGDGAGCCDVLAWTCCLHWAVWMPQ